MSVIAILFRFHTRSEVWFALLVLESLLIYSSPGFSPARKQADSGFEAIGPGNIASQGEIRHGPDHISMHASCQAGEMLSASQSFIVLFMLRVVTEDNLSSKALKVPATPSVVGTCSGMGANPSGPGNGRHPLVRLDRNTVPAEDITRCQTGKPYSRY